MKKRFLALAMTCALAAGLLAGCAGNGGSSATPSTAPSATPSAAPSESVAPSATAPAAEGGLKTGLALLTSVSGKDAGEKNGKVQSDIVAAAVLVGEDGKIVSCYLDILQAKIEVTAQGALAADPAAELLTKGEYGDEYGMKKASKIGKEWYEQAQAFEAWTVGKTAEEMTGAVGEDGKTTDADLLTSCTVTVDEYVKAVIMAMENAKPLGAASGDRLGLGIEGSAADSKAAAADAEGVAKVSAYVSAVTLNDDGKITSEVIDAVETRATFDTAGKITVSEAEPSSKNVLGDSYGMKKASPIGKEWYEQMEAFSAAMAGKGKDDMTAVMGEDGKAADADLLTSCTVHVSDPLNATMRAMGNVR